MSFPCAVERDLAAYQRQVDLEADREFAIERRYSELVREMWRGLDDQRLEEAIGDIKDWQPLVRALRQAACRRSVTDLRHVLEEAINAYAWRVAEREVDVSARGE